MNLGITAVNPNSGLVFTTDSTNRFTTPVPAEPNLEQRLIETEQYVQEAHRTLDQLEGLMPTNEAAADPSPCGAIATAARTCRSAANLVSRLKTLHERVGGL